LRDILEVTLDEVKSREVCGRRELARIEPSSDLQGWVKEDAIEKSFTAPGGTIIPSTTNFYTISAAGIDKIEGPGEFTMPKFHGIKIEATGQNIITLGDGNQVDAKFGDLGQSLAELRSAITTSDVPESTKLEFVADIDTIQSQLAKPAPNPAIVKSAWEVVKGAAVVNGCTALVAKISGLLQHLL
jgi:hypothetical protein